MYRYTLYTISIRTANYISCCVISYRSPIADIIGVCFNAIIISTLVNVRIIMSKEQLTM